MQESKGLHSLLNQFVLCVRLELEGEYVFAIMAKVPVGDELVTARIFVDLVLGPRDVGPHVDRIQLLLHFHNHVTTDVVRE